MSSGGLPVTLRTQSAALVMVTSLAIVGLFHSTFAWSSFWAVVALGIAALLSMTILVGRVGATRGSTVTDMFPVIAIILGVLFRDEALHPVALAGAVLVRAGAGLVSRAERRAA